MALTKASLKFLKRLASTGVLQAVVFILLVVKFLSRRRFRKGLEDQASNCRYRFLELPRFVLTDTFHVLLLDPEGSEADKAPKIPAKLDAWSSARCTLADEVDGLFLHVAFGICQIAVRLLQWSVKDVQHLDVRSLPEIVVDDRVENSCSATSLTSLSGEEGQNAEALAESPIGDESIDMFLPISPTGDRKKSTRRGSVIVRAKSTQSRVSFRRRVSARGIPVEQAAAASSLHPFIIQGDVESRKARVVIGCQDEKDCNRWIKALSIYGNMSKRYASAFLWILNCDVSEGLPNDLDQASSIVGDIRNWRWRLCYLERLHTHETLCIIYHSETDEEERHTDVLIGVKQGVVASIENVPLVSVSPMLASEEEHLRIKLRQYSNHVGCSREEVRLPARLHGFRVRPIDDRLGGNVYACEDAETFNAWTAAIECAKRDFVH